MIYTYEGFSDRLSEMRGIFPERFFEPECIKKLHIITRELDIWGKRFNLTAITEPEEVVKKHIADSLFLASCLPGLGGGSLLDVGCGAGFPSLPTAAVLPEISVTALDSTSKKIDYVNATARLMGAENFRGISARAEDASRGELRESFDFVTARAVARLSVLLELCAPFVSVGGYFIAMKGAAAAEEIKEAENAAAKLGCELSENREYCVPGLPDKRFLIIYRKISAASPLYPRNYSQIAKKPL